jgi:hypothetical protein
MVTDEKSRICQSEVRYGIRSVQKMVTDPEHFLQHTTLKHGSGSATLRES